MTTIAGHVAQILPTDVLNATAGQVVEAAEDDFFYTQYASIIEVEEGQLRDQQFVDGGIDVDAEFKGRDQGAVHRRGCRAAKIAHRLPGCKLWRWRGSRPAL